MSKRLILLICCLFFLQGCIEYRLQRQGHEDIYYGGPKTKRYLDPKLGSKGKIYFTDYKRTRVYLGGSLRRGRAQLNPGLLYYPSKSHSIEIGYRMSLFDVKFLDRRNKGDRKFRPFRDAKSLIYIGGIIRF